MVSASSACVTSFAINSTKFIIETSEQMAAGIRQQVGLLPENTGRLKLAVPTGGSEFVTRIKTQN